MAAHIRFLTFILSTLLTGMAHAGPSPAPLPVEDRDFSCVERADAQRYVSTFSIDIDSFGGLELCNQNSDSKKLFNDLILVEQGRFAGSASNLFIRGFVPSNGYYEFLQDMTRGIRRGHDIPYATAYNSWGYFTMQDGWSQLSTLGRVGTLIHEARHTDGHSHTRCQQGPYKDYSVAGCDTSLPAGGSHGVEMEYYSRVVLQGQNFHPVYQQMARLMNLGRANFVFNQSPMAAHDQLVAGGNHELVQLTEQGQRRLPLAIPAGYSLKRTSFGAAFYQNKSAQAIDLYDSSSEAVRDEYSYYKFLLGEQVGDLKDLEEVDIGPKRYLVALTAEGELKTYNFGQGRWSNPQPATNLVGFVTTAPNGTEGLFVVTDAQEVIPLHPGNLQLALDQKQKWPDGIVDLVRWQQQTLAVEKNGRVIHAESGEEFEPLKGMTVEQAVKVPLYDVFSLSYL